MNQIILALCAAMLPGALLAVTALMVAAPGIVLFFASML